MLSTEFWSLKRLLVKVQMKVKKILLEAGNYVVAEGLTIPTLADSYGTCSHLQVYEK